MGFTSILHFKSGNYESANTLSKCESKATLPYFKIVIFSFYLVFTLNLLILCYYNCINVLLKSFKIGKEHTWRKKWHFLKLFLVTLYQVLVKGKKQQHCTKTAFVTASAAAFGGGAAVRRDDVVDILVATDKVVRCLPSYPIWWRRRPWRSAQPNRSSSTTTTYFYYFILLCVLLSCAVPAVWPLHARRPSKEKRARAATTSKTSE